MRTPAFTLAIVVGLTGCADPGPTDHAAAMLADEQRWSGVTRGAWSVWRLDEDGTPVWDPVGGFNAWSAGLPERDRAWPEIERITNEHPIVLDEELQSAMPGVEDPEIGVSWAAAVRLIEQPETGAAVDELLRALQRPRLGQSMMDTDKPGSPAPSLLSAGLPSTGVMHRSARFLNAVAMYELGQGRSDRFVEIVAGFPGFARLFQEFPGGFQGMLSFAAKRSALDLVSWALENHPDLLSDESLASLDRTLATFEIREGFWDGETLVMHDWIRRVARIEGSLDKASAAAAGADLGAPLHEFTEMLPKSVRRTLEEYEQGVALARGAATQPWDPSASALSWYKPEHDRRNTLGTTLVFASLGSVDSLARARIQSELQTAGVRLAIAAYRARLRSGSFPESIDAVPQDLLPFDPIDGFTGERLKYRIWEGVPLIYSVGRDTVDNKGMIHPGSRMLQEDVKGDWVLFPERAEDGF